MYEIIIENLIFEALIGILPEERKAKQRIQITAHISYSAQTKAKSAQQSQIPAESSYIDYALIRQCLISHIQTSSYALLEDALQGSIKALKDAFPSITHINLHIKKLDIFSDCIIGVKKSATFSKNSIAKKSAAKKSAKKPRALNALNLSKDKSKQ